MKTDVKTVPLEKAQVGDYVEIWWWPNVVPILSSSAGYWSLRLRVAALVCPSLSVRGALMGYEEKARSVEAQIAEGQRLWMGTRYRIPDPAPAVIKHCGMCPHWGFMLNGQYWSACSKIRRGVPYETVGISLHDLARNAPPQTYIPPECPLPLAYPDPV